MKWERHTRAVTVSRAREAGAFRLSDYKRKLGCSRPAAGARTHAKALQNPSTTPFELRNFRGQADCTSDPSTNDYGTATTAKMSLVSGEKSNFQFILRLLNTNVRFTLPDRIAREEMEFGLRWRMRLWDTDGKTDSMGKGQYANAYTTG